MVSTALRRSVPVARRQLLRRRGRTTAAVAGIAMALLLMLALRAIFAGLETRLTAYIDSTGADVIVAQEGVTTMHMTESALPPSAIASVRRTPGVASAIAIVYRSGLLEAGGRRAVAAVVAGSPQPTLVAGTAPQEREIVVDRVAANELRLGVGSTVRAFGASFRVSGEVEGTAAINGSYAFVGRSTLERILRLDGTSSYILVDARTGISSRELARRIEARTPRLTATPRAAFAASERRAVRDMSTGIVRGMTLVALVIGVAIAGLVAYAQTLAQLRDYGVLRAIGTPARRAAALAVAQVAAVVGAGLLAAFVLLGVLTLILPELSPTLVLALDLRDAVEASTLAVGVALAAAAVPVVRVSRIDPVSVFRRPI